MQLELFSPKTIKVKSNRMANKLQSSDRPFHDWYRFVLSFPAHLVREYIDKFGLHQCDTILDPFCGTGTTLVEAKLQGLNSIGIEANPMAHFASRIKINWSINPDELLDHASRVAEAAKKAIKESSHSELWTLPPEAYNLLLKNSISSLPLHKCLILKDKIQLFQEKKLYEHELLAFAKAIVFHASNLHFGPEVGVSRAKKSDALVVEYWISEIKTMANDLRLEKPKENSIAYHADARQFQNLLEPNSISELRHLKKGLLRSNTRNVYKGDNDDIWISEHKEIQRIADTIEKRRIELGKTSGFEKLYSKVTKLYFSGMARHLAELRPFLKKDTYLGYVVGDQASYLRVIIRTGTLLSEIAQSLGYEIESIDLFRTRFATATKKQMREEIVVLRWPGKK